MYYLLSSQIVGKYSNFFYLCTLLKQIIIKEMEKVVERNPVVENKAVNKIMIALYSIVVLSLIAPALDGILRHDFSELGTANSIVTLVLFALKIFSFIYGLVNAIRGTLSPKRMGAVIGQLC